MTLYFVFCTLVIPLKVLVIKILMDDFGTGYSSLSYLSRLPLDTLKIDRSFVKECDSHIEDGKICETIIHLARNLELVIVAEGVETAPQAETLKSLGCEIFQGYYYHRPMNSESISKLLTKDYSVSEALHDHVLSP